ncbi:MAG: TrbC/VirB2 family protein [Coxiellaceae bacterium]|nr:TrbC/VirB2 family protein [Coxiellaceae bacterium]
MRRIMNRLLAYLIGLSLPCSLFAAGSGGDVISNVLRGLIDLLTSTPARLVFVVAIIGVGYGTLALGKIPKQRAIATVIGIGIVFSASYIAQKIGLGG